jgi:DNA-binding response OmpR family regulator
MKKKKKILVVDDEKDVLFMLEKRLTAEGYSVITTTKSTNAIALAKSQHPDIIILDIVMPGMDGGEVAAKLREHPLTRSIPVIFLTALLTKTEEYQGNHTISSNITFAKPFDTEELLAQIKELLCNVTTS